MRGKEHTINKLDAQNMKLNSLTRMIEQKSVSGEQAINLINQIKQELEVISNRLGLEASE
jgi:hypothetical protein